MKTQQTQGDALMTSESHGETAPNVPLSSLSELDVAAQQILEEVERRNSERMVKTLGFVFLHPGGVTTTKLRQLTGLDRTLLSPILTRLIRRGYIERIAYGVYQRSPRTFKLPDFKLEKGINLGL